MNKLTTTSLAGAVALIVAQAATAGTAPFFNPLTQSTAVASPNHVNELNSPWQTPAGVTITNLTSMSEIEADVNQSIQRVDAGTSSSMFDMLAYDPTGRYIFIPHETPFGAGVSRYDTDTDTSTLMFAGDEAGPGPDGSRLNADDDWSNDFGAFDPARYTPNGTIIAAEEWSGLGRVVELLDPMMSPADPIAGGSELVEGTDYRILDSIARVSHEGINFSLKNMNEVIYYIDEDRSGCVYKLELATAGDYVGGGQTYVLSVDNFIATGGDPSVNWNAGPNPGASRFGQASWVAITDAAGNSTTSMDAFVSSPSDPRPGRAACDEVDGTPYGRPEDMAIGMLPNGNEILYVATTSEAAVISIEETSNGPVVRQFAKEGVTPKNVGFEATTGIMNSPDNLAIDQLGNIYIIEDSPNSSDVGGDVWFARDMDNDGVAESIDHFLSLQVAGSEATGMIFDPADPSKFVVAVQHPRSTDLTEVPGGFGDAIWEFDLADVVPPTCEGPRSNWMTFDWENRRWVRACSSDRDFNFVSQLENGTPDFPNP